MNRAHDFSLALPHMIEAAETSPPVEIMVLDYNSSDNLAAIVNQRQRMSMSAGVTLMYRKYTGREHYHLAHAWNLVVKASSGEYVVIMGADALLHPDYVVEVRERIDKECLWMRGAHYKGITAIKKMEFLAAGGFDERFEFYGGEDKDLELRLLRRGLQPCVMPDNMVRTLRTSNSAKVKNYRLDLSKREMMRRGSIIRKENIDNKVLVANEGKEWGAWT